MEGDEEGGKEGDEEGNEGGGEEGSKEGNKEVVVSCMAVHALMMCSVVAVADARAMRRVYLLCITTCERYINSFKKIKIKAEKKRRGIYVVLC